MASRITSQRAPFKPTRRKQFTRLQKLEILAPLVVCPACHTPFGGLTDIEWDHIKPIALGGEHSSDNGQPLCPACHNKKTKRDNEMIDKSNRQRKHDETGRGTKRKGAKLKGRPFPTKYRRRMNGTIEMRAGK